MTEVKIIGQMDNTLDNTFESANRVYDKNGLCPTIPTCAEGGIQPKIIEETHCVGGLAAEHNIINKIGVYKGDIALALPANLSEGSYKYIVAMRGRNPEHPTDRTPGIKTEQRLEMNKDGLVNTLTTVQEDNLLLEKKIQKVGQISSDGSEYGTVISENGLSSNLVAGTHGYENNCVLISQATKEGSIKCKVGGCYDASYPDSKTRRGRVQEGGDITPTITAQGGENINFVEGVNYEKEKRISKVLCILRSKIGTESFSEWAIRGLYCFLKKEVLRQRMYAKIILENWRKSTDLGQFTSDCKVDKSTATPEEELRDLWKDWEARCTPYRRQLSEQQYGQLKNYMQELSYENTPTENILLCLWEASEGVGILRKALSEIQEIWESDVDEQRTQTRYRIRKLTPRETWRLMGYTDTDYEKAASVNSNTQLYKQAGNAIVKQVLMAIFSQLLN